MIDSVERLRCQALALLVAFSEDKPATELLNALGAIQDLWTTTDPYVPQSKSKSYLNQHLRFLELHLRNDEPDKCEVDARSLVNLDIPGVLKSLKAHAGTPIYNEILQARVESLLLQQEYDSAIRRAFTVLKKAIINKYAVSDDLDGDRLVNACFGKDGVARKHLDDAECDSYRGLLSGLYGLFRNKYGHNDLDGDWTEAATIIAMINWILVSLDRKGQPTGGSQDQGIR